MATILKDWESDVELSRKRGRGRSRVGTHSHNLAAGGLDCIQLSLQLHELLLTGASTASFKEVDDNLRPAKVGERYRAPAAGWNRVAGHGRPNREATASAPSTAGAGVPELRDGDKRRNENHDAASNRVRPPVA
jgi:hypothetical protein